MAEATDRVTERLVDHLNNAGAARYVPRLSSTDSIAYSVPALEAALVLDDCRCVLPSVRVALSQAFVEAGRRHLGYAHRLRVMARDLFLACERGEYSRASLMIGTNFTLRKTSIGSVASNGLGSTAASNYAISTLGATNTTMGVLRRASTGTVRNIGIVHASDEHNPVAENNTSAGASLGLGTIQV